MKYPLVVLAYEAVDAQMATFAAAGDESGLRLACRPGCAACCDCVPHVMAAEAYHIAAAIQSRPSSERRAIVDRLHQWRVRWRAAYPGDRHARQLSTILSWQAQQIACPLLDPETRLCTVYDVRPIVCRTMHAVYPQDRQPRCACGQCPVLDPPEACSTTERHVEIGHAPSIMTYHAKLGTVFGRMLTSALVEQDQDEGTETDVLAEAVLKEGMSRYGWMTIPLRRADV